MMTYKPGTLVVINDNSLFILNSDSGELMASKSLTSPTLYKFTGLTFEYEWTSQYVYSFYYSLANSNTIMVKYDIENMQGVKEVAFPQWAYLKCKYGKIAAAATQKHFVVIINNVFYMFDDTFSLNQQIDFTSIFGIVYSHDIHLGENSFIVSLF